MISEFVLWRLGNSPRRLDAIEREVIINTLEHVRGCRLIAAQALGISIRGLRQKIRGYERQGFKIPRSMGLSKFETQQVRLEIESP